MGQNVSFVKTESQPNILAGIEFPTSLPLHINLSHGVHLIDTPAPSVAYCPNYKRYFLPRNKLFDLYGLTG
jgi:hypothetical protein